MSFPRRMGERPAKALLAAQALLLLLPATLAMAFIVLLSYPAYPHRYDTPWQLAFDIALLLAIAGLAAAWRLVLLYVRRGSTGLRRVHPAWLALIALGALPGLAGVIAAALHFLQAASPGASVGFGLLAPAAALLPLAAQLLLERVRWPGR